MTASLAYIRPSSAADRSSPSENEPCRSRSPLPAAPARRQHRPPRAATVLLDAAAVAERLDLSLRTVRRLIATGELPVHRLGRAVRISEDDLGRPEPRWRCGCARTRLCDGQVSRPWRRSARLPALLSELLPISGAQNAGTVRNRTLRVGEEVVRRHPAETAKQPAAQAAGAVVVGLDGGYVRSRHRHEERHFEVVAGKVIDVGGAQHRFAFARNGQAASAEAFRQALAAAGVRADTPATVLCDGDAGLWRLQREALPGATIVLDWWHAAVRFEHALQAARGLGAGTADASLAHDAVRSLERAKWCLWHGRWTGCRRKLASPTPLDEAQARTRRGRHRPPPAARQRAAGLPRTQPGRAGPLRCPAPAWRADLDRVRGERGQRDRGQAHEQGAADALEQGDRAALPGRAHSRAERHARGRLPSTLSGLPARER